MLLQVILEGIGLGVLLILVCAIGIRKGAVGMVHLYSQEVQERCVTLGLTTHAKITRNDLIFIALIVDKPLVCQRICPTACKSDDLRPAVGAGMHFYRKRKRLLCKKCQK